MQIRDIEVTLDAAMRQTLQAMDVPQEAIDQISLADAPDPSLGDRGFPCFALARHLRSAPATIAEDVAARLRQRLEGEELVAEVLTAGPYVNLRFAPGVLAEVVLGQALDQGAKFGCRQLEDPQDWMIEFSAPNTNKPQHLGHVRNNLLGDSIARVLEHVGHRVMRVNLINDRGIHICKSMLAYQRHGQGSTPERAGKKGDHFVGDFYVRFDREFAQEYQAWLATSDGEETYREWLDSPASRRAQKEAEAEIAKVDGVAGEGGLDEASRQALRDHELREAFHGHYKDRYFNTDSELGGQARAMRQRWEQGDPETMALWRRMNSWCEAGFHETYGALGVYFDRVYFESDTYKLGKGVVQQGLQDGSFHRTENGAHRRLVGETGAAGGRGEDSAAGRRHQRLYDAGSGHRPGPLLRLP